MRGAIETERKGNGIMRSIAFLPIVILLWGCGSGPVAENQQAEPAAAAQQGVVAQPPAGSSSAVPRPPADFSPNIDGRTIDDAISRAAKNVPKTFPPGSDQSEANENPDPR